MRAALITMVLGALGGCTPGLDAIPLVPFDAQAGAADATTVDDATTGADARETADAPSADAALADARDPDDATAGEPRDAEPRDAREHADAAPEDALPGGADAPASHADDGGPPLPDAAEPPRDAAAPDAITTEPGDASVVDPRDARPATDAAPRDSGPPVMCGPCQRPNSSGTACETAVGELCGRYDCNDYVYGAIQIANGDNTLREECHRATGPADAAGFCDDGPQGAFCRFFPPSSCQMGGAFAICADTRCSSGTCIPGELVSNTFPCVAPGSYTAMCLPVCQGFGAVTTFERYHCDTAGDCAFDGSTPCATGQCNASFNLCQ